MSSIIYTMGQKSLVINLSDFNHDVNGLLNNSCYITIYRCHLIFGKRTLLQQLEKMS